MVFTCWVGRPESAWGSGCLSIPPQTILSCTEPLSEPSPRESKLTAKTPPRDFRACICSRFGLYSLQLSAIRKMLQQVVGHSQLPAPHSHVQAVDPLHPLVHSSLQFLLTLREAEALWFVGGFLRAVLLCPGLHLPNGGLLGDWDFVELLREQNHLLLLK